MTRTTGALIVLLGSALAAQSSVQPTNLLPNPYETVPNYFKLPEGRIWGSTSAVDIDRDGTSVWIAERCGANSCVGSRVDPVLKFDASGKLVKSFGSGMFIFPHGIHVDREGYIWVTDGRAATPEELEKTPAARGIGNQVFKFNQYGTVVLTLGKKGVAGDPPEALTEPNDVVTAPNGDIFVAEGHSGQNQNAPPNAVARISKFNKNGKFIKSWGKLGTGPGQFRTPHALALDSRGRLYVADRGNVRIQIFDLDGNFIADTQEFSRPSGIFIDKSDTIYVADSESSPTSHPGGWKRGIRIGSAKDLKAQYLIPDPDNPDPSKTTGGTSAAEGVAVDAKGVVYGAEVGPKAVKRYVRKAGSTDRD